MNEKNSRRQFLKTSGLMTAGAAAAAYLPTSMMVHAAGDDVLKVALIGAGGRGSQAAMDCIDAGGNVKIVAVADAFERKAQNAARQISQRAGAKADITPERVFSGLDAYQKAIDCGVDMVLIASPPGFKPLHYEAAIKAGKHVFMEKPVLACAGGYRKVAAANKMADEKNLRVVVGLQRHHEAGYQAGIEALAEGKRGEVTLLRVYWNGTEPWNRGRSPEMTEMQYQVNNWYHFAWLSGDNIGEQHVHNIDIGNWVMTTVLKKEGAEWAHPVEANGMGACTRRGYNGKNVQGQIFDTHFVEFTFENGVKMFSQCRHQPNTFQSVNEYVHTTTNPKGSTVAIGTRNRLKFGSMAQEHYELQQAITQGKKHNEGHYGAVSSMTAVLGRMATYSGKVIRWDELVEKGQDMFPANLTWDMAPPVVPDKDGFYPIPVPGRYDPFTAKA
jgi:myo-inositol 2-dehydrogenase / D-chiro-inositol 1-dehydrogenase